jgi:site-specific DNA-methyltransferase (adenine-specific)
MITDPPYGINYNAERQNLKTGRKYGDILNDDDQYDLRFIFAVECHKIIFGANNFPYLLPFGGRWLVWDKRCDPKADKALGSPFELAWCSLKSGYDKIYRIQHGGFINADKGKRVHPTQKPVKLLTQVILDVVKDGNTIILDPFMGSGTTLIAAKNLGIKAVGIEIEEKYCEIAVRRLQQEIMFVSRLEMGTQANNGLHTTQKGGEQNWLFN